MGSLFSRKFLRGLFSSKKTVPGGFMLGRIIPIPVLIEKRRINVTFCKELLDYNEFRDWCTNLAYHKLSARSFEL